MTYSSSMKVAMVTAVKPDKREMALTILARMIVRAYLGEINRGEAGPNAYRDEPSRQIREPVSNTRPESDNE
jgi:hypothetical protein